MLFPYYCIPIDDGVPYYHPAAKTSLTIKQNRKTFHTMRIYMRQTILALSLAVSILSQSHLQAQQTAEFVIPANSYQLTSTAGTFTDIADNPATVKLGETLPAGTALKDGFFVNAPNEPFVTHKADKTKTDPGFPLGFEFNFCGKNMTHFTICASGGLHFGADADIPQAQSSAWTTNAMTADYQNILTVSTQDANQKKDTVLSIADKAPAMYLLDGEAGQKVLTVQYTYAVNNDEWIYQIKVYEKTGRMELIVGDLKTDHAGDSEYRLFFGLVENGNMIIKDDPLKTLNLTYSQHTHKIGFNQTAASAWDAFTTTTSSYNGMSVTAASKPESGRTLAFTLPDCSGSSCLKPEAYTFETTAISKTRFSGKIAYDKSKITPNELAGTGTVVAVLSTSETPDYTLTDGTYYRAGDPIGNHRVLLNAKPGYQIRNGAISGNIAPLTLADSNLTPGTPYYLHIYSMNYQCLKAPAYSDLCQTFRFTSSLELPKKLSAGLPTPTAVPLTVQSAGEGFGLVLLKSPNTKPIALSGQLKAGDKFGEAEVLTVIDQATETQFDAPLAAGEGTYILAVSATGLSGDAPVYASDFLAVPVRAAYDGLPVFDDFAKEAFTYGSPTEYKRLPFGWSRETAFPDGQFEKAFGLGRVNETDPIALVSVYPDLDKAQDAENFWADVVTPAFVCPNDIIQVSFQTSYHKPATQGDAQRYTPGASDRVRIAYSADGGEWIDVLDLKGNDDEFPQITPQGRYTLTAMISKITPGSILRIRYSYCSPAQSTGSEVAPVMNTIHNVTVIEGKACEAPKNFVCVDSLTTDGSLTFRWFDNNLPQAPNFIIAYRETADENGWKYRRVKANANGSLETPIDGLIPDLTAATPYTVKVAALCGARDSSFYTESLTAHTAASLPYEESMAQTGSGNTAQTPFGRGVKAYTGVIGGPLTESATGWSQTTTSDPYNRAIAVSIGDFTSDAWLMLPDVFIAETGDFTPKSLNFTLSSFNADKQKGVRPNYDDTKLHVLASKNGIFTRGDIIKTLGADNLALTDAAFSIDLTEREGRLKIAFVFECPSAVREATEEDGTPETTEPWYVEISQLNIDYDVDVCFPVSKLRRSLGVNEVPVSWEASASAVEYGIAWGLDGDENAYTDSAYTKETQYTITGLQEQTRYKIKVIAYCSDDRSLYSDPATTDVSTLLGCHTPTDFRVNHITLTGADFSSKSDQPDHMSLRLVYVWPENTDDMRVFTQMTDTLSLRDSLKARTNYIAATQAICGTDTSAMSEEIRFFTEPVSTEQAAQINASFNVRAQDGRIIIRNLNGWLINNVTVYNVSGARLAGFRADSRDDLVLPVDARHALIFVRLQTEKGIAVYKTYLQ